jgi:hypothetical protein
MVVAVEGVVDLQRDGWSGSTRVHVGTLVVLGDLLIPKGQAKATILCTDMSVVTLADVAAGIPCPVDKPVLRHEGARVIAARSSGRAYPVLVSPRGTLILERRPTIRWRPVQGVDRHVVTIVGKGFSWTSPPVAGSELRYPDTQPPLARDVSYQISVQGGGASSADEGSTRAGFRIAGPETEAQAADASRRVAAAAVTPAARGLALSRLQSMLGLQELALLTLESVRGTAGPACDRVQAEVHLKMGRSHDARRAYEAFLSSAPAEDIEGRAEASAHLARLVAASESERARQLADQSQRLYTALGATKALEELKLFIRALGPARQGGTTPP